MILPDFDPQVDYSLFTDEELNCVIWYTIREALILNSMYYDDDDIARAEEGLFSIIHPIVFNPRTTHIRYNAT